jgi:hypothetical protein
MITSTKRSKRKITSRPGKVEEVTTGEEALKKP